MPEPTTIRQMIEERLDAAYHRKLVERGWWCWRCECEALPHSDDYTRTGIKTPGWCPICGMDPRVEGPAKPPFMHGLRGIMQTPVVDVFDRMLSKALDKPFDLTDAIRQMHARPPEPTPKVAVHPDVFAAYLRRWQHTGKLPFQA